MKVKGKYDYDYLALNIQSGTVRRFRRFAKKTASTQSIALAAMLDFFEWHGYSPFQRFGKDILEGQQKTRKRINAAIAIMKDIEKSQNIPLINIETMLQALFQGKTKLNTPKPILEKNEWKSTNKESKNSIPIWEHEHVLKSLQESQERLEYVLGKVEWIKNRFGADYLKLNIQREELERLRRTLKQD